MPDIRMLADKAAEKIRGGYSVPHAINSALKDVGAPFDRREGLRREIAQELNRRSQQPRKKNKKIKQETEQYRRERLERVLREEREREAARMAHERGDHLLADP